MSKDIIIQQSGFPESLTVDALRTGKQGSGSEDWLPAEGKNLVELDIGGSGTYKASDYGAYGIAVARVTPKYGGGATSKAAQQPEFGNLHTIAIHEGGKPVLLSARMVKANQQGGGTCLWVPEDEVNLETKYVDHSGTYPASADNCYGYSQITVSGVDVEVTQDEDGNDVAEITDGGETKTQKLPSSIVVVTPPTNPYGIYTDGQIISTNGMFVKAYLKTGGEYGTVPNEETTISPVTAVYDPATDVATATKNGKSIDYTFGHASIFDNTYTMEIVSIDCAGSVVVVTMPISQAGIDYRFVPISTSVINSMTLHIYGPGVDSIITTSSVKSTLTINGTTYHYLLCAYSSKNQTSTPKPSDTVRTVSDAIDVIFYGDNPPGSGSGQAGSHQTITVSWPRPIDGKVLETTFEILVAPPIYGDSEN